MATLDLTAVHQRDGFVIYFGGRPSEVDTYTFANALVALSDAFREINSQVNPGHALELRLQAVADGSFKAKLKEIPKSVKDALRLGGTYVVLPILLMYLYDEVLPHHKTEEIIVNTDEVIVQRGEDRIIIPRAAYNRAQSLPDKPRVAAHVAKAVAAVEADPNVTSLGIYKDFDTEHAPPALLIDRDDFAVVRAAATGAASGGGTRTIPERVTLAILKAVMAKTDRKWEFVWNGVKISAPITDPIFWVDLAARKYLIGSGDGLDVTLEIEQAWDDGANVWLNTGYTVSRVHGLIRAVREQPLDL